MPASRTRPPAQSNQGHRSRTRADLPPSSIELHTARPRRQASTPAAAARRLPPSAFVRMRRRGAAGFRERAARCRASRAKAEPTSARMDACVRWLGPILALDLIDGGLRQRSPPRPKFQPHKQTAPAAVVPAACSRRRVVVCVVYFFIGYASQQRIAPSSNPSHPSHPSRITQLARGGVSARVDAWTRSIEFTARSTSIYHAHLFPFTHPSSHDGGRLATAGGARRPQAGHAQPGLEAR